MLSACAGSPAKPDPGPAPDPVVERQIIVKAVCPAELRQPIPPEPPMPADAVIDAADNVLGWLAARFSREALLEERIRDARTSCPDE